MAGPVHGGGRRGADARQDAQARQTTAADRHRAESGRPGARAAAGRNNPLDRPDAGESRRGEPAFGATYSRSPPTRAASHPHVQAVERPEVPRETQRRRRPLCRSSCPCGCPLSRRKEPDSGARPHPARVADEAGPCRHDDPRLQTSRHHNAVCCPQYPRRHRHRPQHAAPSPPRVHSLPQHGRGQVPAGKVIHAIVDNYATHKHPKVRQWLARHPRWTFHFTPTSASWLNAVEGFFAKLTKRRLKRGIFLSVVDLQAAINRFVVEHNAEPKPFTWTADPDKIIQAVRRGHQMLDASSPWRRRSTSRSLTLAPTRSASSAAAAGAIRMSRSLARSPIQRAIWSRVGATNS